MESSSDYVISENSLNLSKKIPGNLFKAQNKIFKGSDDITFNDEKMKIENSRASMSPTLRKKIYSKGLKKEKTKKDSESLSAMKGKSSFKQLKITQNVRNSALKMIKNYRRRKQYQTLNNLSEYHYRLIGDVTGNPEELKNERDIRYKRWFPRKILMVLQRMLHLEDIINKLQKSMPKAQNYFMTRFPTFNPNSPFVVAWDFLVMALTFCRIYFYSIEKGFVTELPLIALGSILLLALLIDIGIKLNTKIFQEGVEITERGLILREFVRKNIFSDVFPCLAFSILYFSNDPSIFNELNLLLCGKILRSSELGERIKGLIINSDIAESVYNFFILLIKIFLMAHTLACLWHYIGFKCNEINPQEKNWLKSASIEDESWSVRYLFSIYWAVTTMLTVGYGDIIPNNNQERLFNIWAMFIGCGMFGYTMNFIGEIIKFAERKNGILKEQMNRVTLMMSGKNLPLETQTKVKKYLEFVWNQDLKEDPEHENFIMSKLSSKLRGEIFFHTHVKYLKSVPAFKGFTDHALIELASYMKKVRFSPEELVYKDGDQEEACIYFVLEGKLSMVNLREMKPPVIWRNYMKGDYFGVEEVFSGKARSHGICAIEFSSLFQLSRNDIIKVLKKFPNEYEKFAQIKDLDIVYNEHSHYKITCVSCGFNDHKVYDCRFLKYDPSRLLLIAKYNARKKSFAKKFKRRLFHTNALKEKNTVNASISDLNLVYHDDEDFKDLSILYLALTREKEFSKDSIDVDEREEEREKKEFNADISFPRTRSLKSVHNATPTSKSALKLISVSDYDPSKDQNSPKSPKIDKLKWNKEPTIPKTNISSWHNSIKKKFQMSTYNMDKIKSYIFYFQNNNIENLLGRIYNKS